MRASGYEGYVTDSVQTSQMSSAPRAKRATPLSSGSESRARRIKRAYYRAHALGVTALPMSAMAMRSLLLHAFSLVSRDETHTIPVAHAHPIATMILLPRQAPRLFIALEALYTAHEDAPRWLGDSITARRLPMAIRDLTAWAQRRQASLSLQAGAVACALMVDNVLQITETLSAPVDLGQVVETVTTVLTSLPL